MTDEHDGDSKRGTPEGHTPEKPAPSEIGELGTPGAGLTPDAPHAADAELVARGDPPADPLMNTGHQAAATHADAHAVVGDDDHGHAEGTLGPIDWGAWLYAVVGVAVGLVVVAGFWIALN